MFSAYVLSMVLLVADWGQTRTISLDPGTTESNFYLGKYPTRREVDKYFMKVLVANTAVEFLPISTTAKRNIHAGLSALQFHHVSGNASAGIGFNYKF